MRRWLAARASFAFTEDWYLLPANAGNVSIQLETMVGQGDGYRSHRREYRQLLGVSQTESDVEWFSFQLQGGKFADSHRWFRCGR